MLNAFRGLLIALIGVPLLVFVFGRGDADRDIIKPASASDVIYVDIDLSGPLDWDRGEVKVTGHDREEVRVLVEGSGWGQYALDVEMKERAQGFWVGGKLDGSLHWAFGGPRFVVEVRVPRDASVATRVVNAPLNVHGVQGGVQTETEGGQTFLSDVGGDVRVRGEENVSIVNIDGDLDLQSGARGGDIAIDRVDGNLRVSTRGAELSISEVEGQVEVLAARGDVEIEGVRGDVRARSERGSIEVAASQGSIFVDTDHGEIRIAGALAEVVANSGRGEIDVEFLKAPSGVLSTGRGEVNVDVPKDAAFSLEASTGRGRVELDDDFAFVHDPAVSPEGLARVGDDLVRLGQDITHAVGRQVPDAVRDLHEELRGGPGPPPDAPDFAWNWENDEENQKRWEDWGEQWEEWGEEQGRRWQRWGEAQGRDWEAWGRQWERGIPEGNTRRGWDRIGRGRRTQNPNASNYRVGRVNGGGELLKIVTGRGEIEIQD